MSASASRPRALAVFLSTTVRGARQRLHRVLRRPVLSAAAVAAILLLVWGAARLAARGGPGDAVVRRGTLEPSVALVGSLTPERSDSYGALVPGVELKILWLAQEGALVKAGDRLIEFDPAPFQKDFDTARARARELSGEADQARLARDAVKLKNTAGLHEKTTSARDSARDFDATVNTTAPLTAQESLHEVGQRERALEEAETRLAGLEKFVAQGYISQEEYRAAKTRRDQAAADLQLSRSRHSALVHQTNPDLIRRKSEEAQTGKLQLELEQQRSRVELGQTDAAARVAAVRLEEARRQMAEAETKIAACTAVAKGPGLVVHSEVYEKDGSRRKLRVGDAAWGGTTVVTLPDLSRMLVEGRVPESEIHKLLPGQEVRVRLDAFPDRTLTGTLRAIGSVGASEKNASRSFPVTVQLAQTDPRFRPGMAARCTVVCAKLRDALYLPIEAVRSDERGTWVLAVPALGKPSRRSVAVGASTSQFVEIRSGLKEGETVRLGE
ncbi:MAG: efflux RND transporter periplasmic adaptor subunit [Acidobacteriota bacterium]